MINTTRFKKILHILKQNADDLNINICIIDYDVSQECDYEEIILYLKETNTENGAVVYKNFVIRSQLYYDVENDKYMSALDGDIYVQNKAPTRIEILSDITEESLRDIDNKIRIRLIDSETNELLKNQPIFMYFSGESESIASAITNKQGEATFNYHLTEPIFFDEQKMLYFEYLGNKIYRKSKSNYILIYLEGNQIDNITSSVTECVNTNGNIHITYKVSLGRDNLIDGFANLGIDVDETSLLTGKVLFYLHTDQDSLFLGSSDIQKIGNQTISSIDIIWPQEYRNTEVTIQAIFEGNSFVSSNSATKTTQIFTTTPENITLDVNGLLNGFEASLSFDVQQVSGNTFCSEDTGFNMLAHTYGDVNFYLKNNRGTWGTLNDGLPFYTASNYDVIFENGIYSFRTNTDYIAINLNNYGLQADDIMYVKATYDGNAIVDSFEVEASNEEEPSL